MPNFPSNPLNPRDVPAATAVAIVGIVCLVAWAVTGDDWILIAMAFCAAVILIFIFWKDSQSRRS